MARLIRKKFQPWMLIYIGFFAAMLLAGRPADVAGQDSLLPVPAIVGEDEVKSLILVHYEGNAEVSFVNEELLVFLELFGFEAEAYVLYLCQVNA